MTIPRRKLKRIRVPFRQRLQDLVRGPLVLLVWTATAAGAVWLFSQNPTPPTFRGWVPAVEYPVTASMGGTLVACLVQPMQRVCKGEVVARLDVRPLEARIRVARARIAEFRARLDDARRSFALEAASERRRWATDLQRSFIDETGLLLNSMQLQVDLAGDRIEQGYLKTQRQRTDALLASEITAGATAETIAFQQEKIADRVRANSANYSSIQSRLAAVLDRRRELEALAPSTASSPKLQPLQPLLALRAAVEVQALETAALEAERRRTVLTSPVDGHVVSVLVGNEQAIAPGQPIVVVSSDGANRAVVFVPADTATESLTDRTVELSARNGSTILRCPVATIGNRVEKLPEQLWLAPDLPSWGVAVQLPLPPSGGLLPGEVLGARLLPVAR